MLKYYTLLLLMTINNILPLDKISIAVLDIICYRRFRKLSPKVIFVFGAIFVVLCMSYIVNLGTSSLRIFYPLLFLIGAYLFSSLNKMSAKSISYFFLPNIVIGVIGVIYSCITDLEPNAFAVYAWGKSFLFPICATGFSPTPQVYCTFCILYMWISIEEERYDLGFLVSIIGVILSQNRTSYVFVLFVIFLYKKEFLVFFVLLLIPLIYNFKDYFADVIDNKNVDSRSMMRHGFELAYWKSNDISVLFWGIGNNEISSQYSKFNHEGQSYIENGLDFLLAISGFNGFVLYVIVFMCFVKKLIREGEIKICLIFLYYMIVNQWMTQEFLASSFFYFILVVLVLRNKMRGVKCRTLIRFSHGKTQPNIS